MENKRGKASDRARGLSRRQRAFVREKVLGLNDKEAALAAGYAPSVAENTKQKLWAKPQVRGEFERLRDRFRASATPTDK
jgi:phage terminase small subunit